MEQLKSQVSVKGEITAFFYDQSFLNGFDKFYNSVLNWFRKKAPNFCRKYINKNFARLFRFGKLVRKDEHKNVICNAGFNAITKLLTGDTTYTGEINKAVFGTGATGSASASDTQLETETYRNDIASGTDDSNIAYLTAYLTETEYPPAGSVTITEFGNVIDGTGSADTGQLWSHLKGLSWAKDRTTVIVVSCKYTFASA